MAKGRRFNPPLDKDGRWVRKRGPVLPLSGLVGMVRAQTRVPVPLLLLTVADLVTYFTSLRFSIYEMGIR